MESNTDLRDTRLAHSWQELYEANASGLPLTPDAYRLAFTDPEFLQRPETRGIRFQLELLKPELSLAEQGIEHTIVVYGSARFVDPEQAQQELDQARASCDASATALAERAVRNARYYQLAREFARVIARRNKHCDACERLYICTGGGPGIMEAANRGAHDEGEPNIGLNITLPHEQHCNPYITPQLSFKFHYFALRKMHFMMRAKALVVFPGGFGTLDELFEVLTLVQTGKARPVPIVLFGKDFWQRLINFDALVEQGTISADDLKLFHYSDDAADAWAYIKAFYRLRNGN
ncbi:LOG family protein [Comamonas faecalis]|uniref:Cytokinin riboside 5'-monophosphate phosphoribohydrolase n=1 Tax=Comamonas faecalis TaxID=1387849 RepID=A0ABP7RHB8_9BURK